MADEVVWRGIVKVQRELAPHPDASVHIRSQDGSVFYLGPMDSALLTWFEEGEPKFYAYAELIDTIIHVMRRVRERSW